MLVGFGVRSWWNDLLHAGGIVEVSAGAAHSMVRNAEGEAPIYSPCTTHSKYSKSVRIPDFANYPFRIIFGGVDIRGRDEWPVGARGLCGFGSSPVAVPVIGHLNAHACGIAAPWQALPRGLGASGTS